MKLIRVYKNDKDLVIETSEGKRYCRLSNSRFLDIDALEDKCQKLIGLNIKIRAKWGYSNDYFFGEIWEDNAHLDIKKPDTSLKPFSEKERSVQRIFGPPGTGKTTTLMKIIRKSLNKGVKPHEIAFVSFSNAATNEGKNRLLEEFPQYDSNDFINFRTLHSLSVSLGCRRGKKFMDRKYMIDFDQTIENKTVWREKAIAESIIDRDEHFCLTLKSLANARKSHIKDQFSNALKIYTDTSNVNQIRRSFKVNKWAFPVEQGNVDYNFVLAEEWLRLYEEYKDRNNLMDYDDMIAAMMLPDFDRSQMRFKLFIVDEAQDNSVALWSFAKLVIAESKESVVAGDDDQAIMEQFGASPKAFLDLETTKKDIELKISYRLPSEVKKALDEGPGADIKKIKGRKEKKFRIASDAKKGSIISKFISTIKGKKIEERFRLFNLIMDLQDTSIEGDWLIMAPTNHTVEFISSVFYKFDIAHYSKNKPITLKGQKSVDTDIRVQTIHTSKGAEAENVALVLKSQGDFDMYTQGNDESARLAYVAESRTKNRMYHIGFYKIDDKTIIDDSDEVFLNND